jgi:hypothetical protein
MSALRDLQPSRVEDEFGLALSPTVITITTIGQGRKCDYANTATIPGMDRPKKKPARRRRELDTVSAELVREVMRELFEKRFHRNKAAFGRALEMSGQAVLGIIGNPETNTPPKANPSRYTAELVATIAGIPIEQLLIPRPRVACQTTELPRRPKDD